MTIDVSSTRRRRTANAFGASDTYLTIVQELLVGVAVKAQEPIKIRRSRGEPTSDCFLTAI